LLWADDKGPNGPGIAFQLGVDSSAVTAYLHGFPPRAHARAEELAGARGQDPFEDERVMPRKRFGRNRKNRCRFCTPEGCPRPAYVDYKDVGLLKKLCTNQSKMFSRKRSGNCAAFQRASSDAVKRARFMALIPYVGE
jgi:small subunit ribosomal protein S18